ncbi:hypothetical protein U1Q18_014543 [Sarracenia purpurea var. burkii]
MKCQSHNKLRIPKGFHGDSRSNIPDLEANNGGWMKAKSGLAPGGDGFPIGSLVILCSLVEIVSGNGPLGQTSKFVKGLWGSPTIQGRWSMVMRVEMGDIQLLIIIAG